MLINRRFLCAVSIKHIGPAFFILTDPEADENPEAPVNRPVNRQVFRWPIAAMRIDPELGEYKPFYRGSVAEILRLPGGLAYFLVGLGKIVNAVKPGRAGCYAHLCMVVVLHLPGLGKTRLGQRTTQATPAMVMSLWRAVFDSLPDIPSVKPDSVGWATLDQG